MHGDPDKLQQSKSWCTLLAIPLTRHASLPLTRLIEDLVRDLKDSCKSKQHLDISAQQLVVG
jgi:hypothetical protein